MNKLFLCLLFSLLAVSGFCQRVYFVYLQSDQEQPFFVRINEKTHSSSEGGYLILSKLKDSIYTMGIGFPGGKWPEQKFTITVKGKDQGYVLRNFNEKGWGLIDIQTASIQMAAPVPQKSSSKTEARETSAFTSLLALAADDPTLKDKPVVAKVEEKPIIKTEPANEEIKDKVKVEEIVVAKTEPPKVEEKVDVKDKVKVEENAVAKIEPPKEPVKRENPKEQGKDKINVDSISSSRHAALAVTSASIEDKAKVKEDSISTSASPLTEDKAKVKVKEDVKVREDSISTSTSISPSASIKEQEAVRQDEPKQPDAPDYKPSVVRRRSESSTTEGFGLTFIDQHNNGSIDTITILIPNPKPIVTQVKAVPREEKKFLDISSEKDENNEKVKEDSISAPASEDKVKVKEDSISASASRHASLAVEDKAKVKEDSISSTTQPLTPSTSPCKDTATDSDFLKLRRGMAAVESDDEMLDEARKYFKTKCFTTQQIKNLGALFLSDGGKYKFYDLAYGYVSDADKFPSLQSELKEEYYINRFKAMLK